MCVICVIMALAFINDHQAIIGAQHRIKTPHNAAKRTQEGINGKLEGVTSLLSLFF